MGPILTDLEIAWEHRLQMEGMPAELPLLLDKPEMFVPLESMWQIADQPTNVAHIPSATEMPDRWEFLRYGRRKLIPGPIRDFVDDLLSEGSKQGQKGNYPGYWTVAKRHGLDWRQAVRILKRLEMKYLLAIGAGASDAAVRTAKRKVKNGTQG